MAKLESLEYKRTLTTFGKDVHEILDELYQASKPKASAATRTAIAKRARAKLAAYDALLAKLEGNQRASTEKDYAHWMTEMRESLAKLEP